MVIWVILFAVIHASPLHNPHVTWLKSPRVTPWGQFGPEEFCPRNSFVTGMRLKMDHFHIGDNTALNAIQLICANINGNNTTINSTSGDFGYFGEIKSCKNGFATGFQLRSQSGQGFRRDDVAAVDFKLMCTDINGRSSKIIAQDNGKLPWGFWTQAKHCPRNSAVCGITTQVESLSGPSLIEDQTSLNNVDIACCSIARPIGACTLNYNWETLIACSNESPCEVKLITGITDRSEQMSKFRKFYDNQRSQIGSFDKIVMEFLQIKAEQVPDKINNKSLKSVLQVTKLKRNDSMVSVMCKGIIQQLIVTCDFIKLYTSENRCVPDQSADKEWEVKGLYFLPTSHSENIFWGYNCDFTGGNVGSAASTIPGNCGEMCLSNTECTHFAWNDYNRGTCWMKGGLTTKTPVERFDKKTLCGWVERTQTE